MTEPNLDETLQLYFDGELPPEEADALRVRIESEPELQAKLDGLAHLRTMLQAVLAPERLAAPDADAMFAAIEGSLAAGDEAEPEAEEEPEVLSPVAPGLRVVAGGKKDAGAEPAPSRGPLWLGVGAVVLAAAAAFWFFVIRPGQTETPDTNPDPIAAAPPPGSEIEQIDFGHSTGAIFQVEDEGAQYAVVWISDEKPDDFAEPAAPEPDRIQ
ncbi:MAG: hypothetical protein H6719_19640 [Sandaracinaceae bacterium]|nr:hypothetical protein [Sandaracinaceae bacterium]